ncbi:16S rRNA (guanine527-N7)-methyltransferase [Desulfitispora alkaliphila]|uniref:16S rRNA (guanine(527)-N(7))-methyltransferase RsmG n=1 Tax=Desulfitispora alkaliphila TaxID=622674 RepID=UPI003D2392E0
MTEQVKQELKNILSNIDLNLSEKALEDFKKYAAELIKWNEKFNLTAITEIRDIVEKHFYDSLLAVKVMDFSNVKRMVDIGTGAGFPGLPLKICYPELDALLVDSLAKRIGFLEHIYSELKLDNIQAIHARAEDLGKNGDHREKYDVVVSRAVAPLPILLEYSLPLVAIGGSFISYKGPELDNELEHSKNALTVLGGKVANIYRHNLPLSGNNRVLVEIKKEIPTPTKYPRKSGIPSKRPL